MLGVVTDVSSGASVEALRDEALERVRQGPHPLQQRRCRRLAAPDGIWGATVKDWQWALGVNLWGVIHGIRTFVPLMMEHGEGAIVNTASAAGSCPAPAVQRDQARRRGADRGAVTKA